MKKLLGMLSLFSIIGSSSSAVVSCQQKDIKFDMTKLKLNWYNLYNQNIDRTGTDLYNNVIEAIFMSVTDQKSYGIGTIANDVNDSNDSWFHNNKDGKLHISIYEHGSKNILPDNDTLFKLELGTPIIYDVKIKVDNGDQYFNETKSDIIRTVDITPIDQDTCDWLTAGSLNDFLTYNHKDNTKPSTDKQIASSWYTNVRWYFADKMNKKKNEEKIDSDKVQLKDQSNLINENIKYDPNLGIAIWGINGKIISDNNDPINLSDIASLKVILMGKSSTEQSGYDRYFSVGSQEYFQFDKK